MSWQATAWADSLEYKLMGPLATRVLFKLANVAMPSGERAWRSVADLAGELGVSQRSVQRALRELEILVLIKPGDQEFVHHIRADRRPTVYDLNLRYNVEYGQPELPIHGVTELSTDEPRGDIPGPDGVTTVVAHRTILELPTKTSKANHRADVTPNVPVTITSLFKCLGKQPHRFPDDDPESQCSRCFIIRWQLDSEDASIRARRQGSA